MAFTNIMIDIETLGTRPNAPILSIGAVFFAPDTGELGSTFYRAIDPANAFQYGVPDGDTFKWWMGQSEGARKAVVSGRDTLPQALSDLREFGGSRWGDIEVWANDPDFDVTILTYGYNRALNAPAPWKFWNTRSCRTIAKIANKRPPKIKDGTHHNALDDAVHQAKWVSEMWRGLRNVKVPPATQVYDLPATQTYDPLADL